MSPALGGGFFITEPPGKPSIEASILWPPKAKSQLIGKDPDPGKDQGQEEKGTTEDEIIRWHHRLNGLEFEQTLGDGEGQGSLASCSPWGGKESDMTLATEQQHNLHITGNHFFSNIFQDFWHKFSLFLKPASMLLGCLRLQN